MELDFLHFFAVVMSAQFILFIAVLRLLAPRRLFNNVCSGYLLLVISIYVVSLALYRGLGCGEYLNVLSNFLFSSCVSI